MTMEKSHKLTPLDVIHTAFSKSIRGYNAQEVDEFKDKVAKALEELLEENQLLKEKTAAMDEKLRDYTTKEITLQNTLVFAEKSAEERVSSAKKEAELIVEEAQVRAGREKELLQKEMDAMREEKRKILTEKEKALTDLELVSHAALNLVQKYK